MNEYKTEITYALNGEFFQLHADDGWSVVCAVDTSPRHEPRLIVPEFTVWFSRPKDAKDDDG